MPAGNGSQPNVSSYPEIEPTVHWSLSSGHGASVGSDLSFQSGVGVGAGGVVGAGVIVVIFILLVLRCRTYQRVGHRSRSGIAESQDISLPNVRASLRTSPVTAPLRCASRTDSSSHLLGDMKLQRKRVLSLPSEVSHWRRNSSQSSTEDVFAKSPDLVIENSGFGLDAIPEKPPLGTVQFSIRFKPQTSELEVHVVSATHLAASGTTGRCSPYVIVSLSPGKASVQEGTVPLDTTSPDFNETFSFTVKDVTELNRKFLLIRVASCDQLSSCRVLGEIQHPLDGIDFTGGTSYCFTRALEAAGLQQQEIKDHTGDLLFSLSYQSHSNRITVVVLKARNLKAVNRIGACGTDPYVKVYLMLNGKRYVKKKTSVKKNTLCPIYNESFFFDLTPCDITSRHVNLLFLVMDHNPVRQNNVVGRVDVGLECSKLGKEHWKAIASQPGKQIAKWHTLIPYACRR